MGRRRRAHWGAADDSSDGVPGTTLPTRWWARCHWADRQPSLASDGADSLVCCWHAPGDAPGDGDLLALRGAHGFAGAPTRVRARTHASTLATAQPGSVRGRHRHRWLCALALPEQHWESAARRRASTCDYTDIGYRTILPGPRLSAPVAAPLPTALAAGSMAGHAWTWSGLHARAGAGVACSAPVHPYDHVAGVIHRFPAFYRGLPVYPNTTYPGCDQLPGQCGF